MQNRENDIVLFMDENIQLEVPVSQDGESVWLSANQMAVLFDKDETNIRKHINNIFKSSEVDKNNNTQKMRVDGVKQSECVFCEETAFGRRCDHRLSGLQSVCL